MNEFTRLTVRGSARRAEVAVSSDDPIGAVLPQLIDTLAEPIGAVSRPLTLLTVVGEPLDLERTPREQSIVDGSVLRLVPYDAAPPPPLVIDVVDVVAEELEGRDDRWNDRARVTLAGVLVALAGLVVSVALPGAVGAAVGEGGEGLTARLVLCGALLALAVAFGLLGRERIAAVLTSAATGAAIPPALEAAVLTGGGGWLFATAVWLTLAASVLLLLGVGVARRSRGAGVGGALGVVLSGLLLTMQTLGLPSVPAAAVIGTVAALLVGLAPWVALSASGLTGLDHATDRGVVARVAVVRSADEAYRTLTAGVAVLATITALCAIALWMSGGVWGMLLASVLAVVLVLRSRAFPLRVHGMLLWGAAIGILVGAAVTSLVDPSLAGVAVLVATVLAGVAAVAGLARPRPHQRARLRSFGDLIETVAVVALVPLVVGVFGIYADLLALFGGGA